MYIVEMMLMLMLMMNDQRYYVRTSEQASERARHRFAHFENEKLFSFSCMNIISYNSHIIEKDDYDDDDDDEEERRRTRSKRNKQGLYIEPIIIKGC